MSGYRDYMAAAVIHNLDILPESLVCGLVILSIALANPALFTLAAGTLGTQLFAGAVGRILMKFSPDSAKLTTATDRCHTAYLGMSWERLLRGAVHPDQLWHPMAPSIYAATVAFVAGYGFALQLIYKEEINAGVVNAGWMVAFGVMSALFLLLTGIFRVASGCDSVVAVIGGTGIGLLLGFLGTVSLAYVTNRRATNIWGIPLLRDRINDGAAVYICENP